MMRKMSDKSNVGKVDEFEIIMSITFAIITIVMVTVNHHDDNEDGHKKCQASQSQVSLKSL